MADTETLYGAPPGSSLVMLGRTLPSLLDQACDRHPNQTAVNQWQQRQWQFTSNHQLQALMEETALGLLSLGLVKGDRIAFLLQNDVQFCVADLGALLAGLVTVPIDLTQTIENILFVLNHTGARGLVILNLEWLQRLQPYLQDLPTLEFVIVATAQGEQDLSLPEIQRRGRALWSRDRVTTLRQAIAPQDLATILYIASDTQQPQGVMLSHENISADILAAFSSYPQLGVGGQEVALLFLPLTHIFARAFLYGHLAYGHSIYFSDPSHVLKHLKLVNPTIVIAVPRLLEKLHERILSQAERLRPFDRRLFQWALKLAQSYEIGQPVSRLEQMQRKLADRLVFQRWRSLFGDRLKALIVGGAALAADLTNQLTAAGIPVLQGYGLTETSAVLTYNRGQYNRAGTVGVPIPGVEIKLAADGEILVRSPFVMQGYYRDPDATAAVLQGGWLHTGDLGEITPDGFLKLTGVKKARFKLTTGKYVSSLPLEQVVARSPLVEHAIALGANRKFCGMLIFPNWQALQAQMQALNLEATHLDHPCVLALYQVLIDEANCHLPYWSTVRKFRLMQDSVTIANGLLHADGRLNRGQILTTFAGAVEELYRSDLSDTPPVQPLACPVVDAVACPLAAQSFTHS